MYLTTHDDLRPHLHFALDAQDLQSRVKAVTAGGLARFAMEAGGKRLGVCALDPCRTAFVDTSRNGRRASCSARCATTDAVRRHRGRAPGRGYAGTKATTRCRWPRALPGTVAHPASRVMPFMPTG